ncbi:MAG TPA: hypothetical protein VD948_03530 [Rhodothermales bacterium]|nr:hypothetical protein [Rhodothermales bacterium]
MLARKLLLKPGHRVRVVNAPVGFTLDLPEGAMFAEDGPADAALMFAATSAELGVLLPDVVKAMPEDTLLWVAFPKKSSGWQADLTQFAGWEPLVPLGLEMVTLVSVDDTWSAARLRPKALVKHRTARRAGT